MAAVISSSWDSGAASTLDVCQQQRHRSSRHNPLTANSLQFTSGVSARSLMFASMRSPGQAKHQHKRVEPPLTPRKSTTPRPRGINTGFERLGQSAAAAS